LCSTQVQTHHQDLHVQFGFALYQGGVVPGNELRVVHIADTDTEACCGTHCDNTAAVGLIKILKVCWFPICRFGDVMCSTHQHP